MKVLPFDRKEQELFEKGLKNRVDAQYYVDREVDEEVVEKMFEVPHFILKCQKVTEKMTEEEIAMIRRELQTEI